MDIYDDCPENEPRIKSRLSSKGANARAFRSSTDYKKSREQFRYRAQHHRNSDGSVGEPCWLCGEAIDYRLKFPHPRSWSLDHIVPIADNPRLALNPSNYRSAHFDCNNYRQTGEPPLELGVPSEIW
jgi:5-methylcytosine-specific restriction endonuclease McrA